MELRRPGQRAVVEPAAPRRDPGSTGAVVRPHPETPGQTGPNGASVATATQRPPAETPTPTHDVRDRPAAKPRPRLLAFAILAIVFTVASVVGYRFWYESTFFVITENAQVAGDLIQIGSLNAGRLVATRAEVGESVRREQELATIAIPQPVGLAPGGLTTRYDVTGTADALTAVRAPVNGVVVARMASVGGTVIAGQPIYAMVDPSQVWVRANIEETKVARVQPGQWVEIHSDALDRDFYGTVLAITPASAGTFSLLPPQNASGNFVKVTQLVPVKIAVDAQDAVLPLGTSVSVRISVREPPAFPWR